MDDFDALDRSRAELDRRLAAIGANQWDLPTPCSQWTVRGLVQHCVGGAKMVVLLLGGISQADLMAELGTYRLAEEPTAALAEFAAAADASRAAFHEPGALERTCHHPVGDIPGAQLLRFRVGDMTLHAWDLARAIGADEHLDPDLAEDVYISMSPMAPFIATTGFFGAGPSGDVGPDAPAQQRLLDLSGRRP